MMYGRFVAKPSGTPRSRREYKSGARWAFWRWSATPSGYLTRLFLVHTPWGGIMVHFINDPDVEPDMHNHPVTFLSLILRGGYAELLGRPNAFFPKTPAATKPHEPVEWIRRRWFNFVRAEKHVHKIVSVKPGTVTLCFYGPRRCTWGFFTEAGFVPWKEYNRKYKTLPSSDAEQTRGRTDSGC